MCHSIRPVVGGFVDFESIEHVVVDRVVEDSWHRCIVGVGLMRCLGSKMGQYFVCYGKIESLTHKLTH